MSKLKLNQQIFDLIYPVGSVYLTINDVNPQTLFGGTWVKCSGGFIYGSTATGTRGENGNGTGTNTSTAGGGNTGSTAITVDQMPPHNHTTSVKFSWGGGSSYGMSWTNGEYQGPYDNGLGAITTKNTGGGKGHTHTLNNHSHDIPYFDCYIWKRTA